MWMMLLYLHIYQRPDDYDDVDVDDMLAQDLSEFTHLSTLSCCIHIYSRNLQKLPKVMILKQLYCCANQE